MTKSMFGIQVAYFRKQANLTQEELAEKVECATSTISRIECGQEYPRLELFEKLNKIFEQFGITYQELHMDEVFEFQRAKEELLSAIHEGREEVLERKLARFEELMIKDNTEHQQYYALGYLICMRKRGMSIEEYIDRCTELFEKGRKVPNVEDLPKLHLTRIEHMIIFEYAKAHYQMGDNVVAEEVLAALLKNGFTNKTEYHRRRSKALSSAFARIMLKKKEYHKAQECINYTLERLAETFDAGILFKSLVIQLEIFEILKNSEGATLINEFIAASQRMINYLYKYNDDKKPA